MKDVYSSRSDSPGNSDLRPAKVPTRVDRPGENDFSEDDDFDPLAGQSAKIPTSPHDFDLDELDDDLDPDELPEELDIEDQHPEASATRRPYQEEEDDESFADQDEV